MTTTSVHVLDLQYLGDPRAIASYLIKAPEGPILIETGPGSTTDGLTRALAAHDLAPADVKHVLVTHIHFDHAGAAGWMVGQGAQLYVHEFGAKHLIDPTRLIASATRIYGDDMDRLWGTLLPCAPERVTAVHDGDVLDIAGMTIRAIETPGHARHHHTFACTLDGMHIAFTGDAAATFIREAPQFISVPTPPPEFDLAAWMISLDRLAAEGFDRIYPTHFGAVDDVAGHLSRVRTTLQAHTEFIAAQRETGRERPEILNAYRDWFLADAKSHRVPEEYLGFYVKNSLAEMNLTGVMRYLDRLNPQDA